MLVAPRTASSPARQRRSSSAPPSPAPRTRGLTQRAEAGDPQAIIAVRGSNVEPANGCYGFCLVAAVHVPAAVSALIITVAVLLGVNGAHGMTPTEARNHRDEAPATPTEARADDEAAYVLKHSFPRASRGDGHGNVAHALAMMQHPHVAGASLPCAWPNSWQQHGCLACSCLLAAGLSIWLWFAQGVLQAYAVAQLRKPGGRPSILAELIGFAYAKQPLLTLLALLLGLLEAAHAISDELWEFVSCSSAWPLANALGGLGTEVLIVCQIIGAVIEEKSFRRANSIVLNNEPFHVVATIVRIAPLDELPPWTLLILTASWDTLLCLEWWDETSEKPEFNRNRVRARTCALLGVVKSIAENREIADKLARLIW